MTLEYISRANIRGIVRSLYLFRSQNCMAIEIARTKNFPIFSPSMIKIPMSRGQE